MKRLVNLWIRHKTKNLTRIPLFIMTFNYQLYKEHGKTNSCMFCTHPEIARDKYVREELQKVVDYIRDNYDLEIFTKI